METYKKNENYSQENLNYIIDIYRRAKAEGKKQVMQRQMNLFYEYIFRYVYRVCWDSYPTLMKSHIHGRDLIQEIWLKIIEEIDNYDYEKASITTFILPWIKHVVSEYCSKNFSKTSVYYSAAMSKVSAAINYCHHLGIDANFHTIVKITKLPEVTVTQSMELIQRKDMVSYENLTESGYEHTSSILSPEAYILQQEEAEIMNNFLEDVLSKEEREVLYYLITPDDPEKSKASYSEIAKKMHTNIPKVQHTISYITAKLKNNKKLKKYFPEILSMYDETLLESNIPILDDSDFINEQIEELDDLFIDI